VAEEEVAKAEHDEAKAPGTKERREVQDDEEDKHTLNIEQQQPKQLFVIGDFLFVYYNNESR